MDIERSVKELKARLARGNCFGEKVTLVAATKTRTPEEIDRAIAAGIEDIGENRVQEFREKYDLVHGARRHFIGRLQTNKVKYLAGKTFLIHSVDRDELALEIARRSLSLGVSGNILIEVNLGEASKGGYPLSEARSAFSRLSRTEGLTVKGFMAMLPLGGSEKASSALVEKMRFLFEEAKGEREEVEYLSMGMSGDYELCLAHGANMIRLGTAIFGDRPSRGA